MKVLILISALFSLSSAQATSYQSEPWYFSLLGSAFNLTGKRIIGATPKEFLQVCLAPVSKATEANVKQTLEVNTNNMVKLAKAIDRDSVEMLLEVIEDAKMMLKKKIAAIQGTISAAIDATRPPSASSHNPKCAADLMAELQSSFSALQDVQSVTRNSIPQKSAAGHEFNGIHEDLNDLMSQVKLFLKDPTEGQRIRPLCRRTQLMTLIPHIVDRLESMKPILYYKYKEEKMSAIESATGLLTQAITLNAICHAEWNVDQSDDFQEEIMKKDVKISEDAADALDAAVKAIIGTTNGPEKHKVPDVAHTTVVNSDTLADIIAALGGHKRFL